MKDPDSSATQLKQRLAAAEVARARRAQNNEAAMVERNRAYGRFEAAAAPVHTTIVRPMLEELARSFANARWSISRPASASFLSAASVTRRASRRTRGVQTRTGGGRRAADARITEGASGLTRAAATWGFASGPCPSLYAERPRRAAGAIKSALIKFHHLFTLA